MKLFVCLPLFLISINCFANNYSKAVDYAERASYKQFGIEKKVNKLVKEGRLEFKKMGLIILADMSVVGYGLIVKEKLKFKYNNYKLEYNNKKQEGKLTYTLSF